MLLDCPGCVRRREAMRDFGRRMADWVKRPTSPAPVDPIPPVRIVPPDAQIERLALMLFLSENKGSTENDWRCATAALRANYCQAVKAKMENPS